VLQICDIFIFWIYCTPTLFRGSPQTPSDVVPHHTSSIPSAVALVPPTIANTAPEVFSSNLIPRRTSSIPSTFAPAPAIKALSHPSREACLEYRYLFYITFAFPPSSLLILFLPLIPCLPLSFSYSLWLPFSFSHFPSLPFSPSLPCHACMHTRAVLSLSNAHFLRIYIYRYLYIYGWMYIGIETEIDSETKTGHETEK